MILLDRYIIRCFLVPFLLCFCGFLAIWLIFDLQSNTSDFIEAHLSFRRIVIYYLWQLPQFLTICIPVGLLLALLYCLSKMSRSNEIISMLTAGQSLSRVLMPLMGVGLFLTGVCTVLNYAWAPHADSVRKEFKDQISKKAGRKKFIYAQLFRNRTELRNWFVAEMSAKGDNDAVLNYVTILEQAPVTNVVTTEWIADKAIYKADTKTWLLFHGRVVQFGPDGTIQSEKAFPGTLQIDGWSETPWRIASSNLDPQGLSVPELRDYLRFNADFPESMLTPYQTQLQYRWSLPFQCLVVVFFAGPLAVVFSRRGVLTGIAGAIFLFAGLTFFSYYLIACGKGGRVSPFVAAWLPIFLFGLIGLYLLYLKGTNREFPKFTEIFGSKLKR